MSKGKREKRLNYYQFKCHESKETIIKKNKEGDISVQLRLDSNQKLPCMRNTVCTKIVE